MEIKNNKCWKKIIFSDFLPNTTNCVVAYTFLFLFSDTSSCLHPLQPPRSSFLPFPYFIPCAAFFYVKSFLSFISFFVLHLYLFLTINPQSYPSLLSFVASFLHASLVSFLLLQFCIVFSCLISFCLCAPLSLCLLLFCVQSDFCVCFFLPCVFPWSRRTLGQMPLQGRRT